MYKYLLSISAASRPVFFCLALSMCPAYGYAQEQTMAQLSSPVASSGPENEIQSLPMDNAPPPPVGTAAGTHAPSAPAAVSAFTPSGYVEGGGNFNYVSNNYGNWLGEYLKGEIQTDPDNRWNAQILHQKEFGSTGNYGNIGNTHTFNEDWYSSVTAGVGDGGLYLPRYRIDAFINKKWLEDRQLITTFGVGADEALDNIHKDESIFLGATYYFKAPWIVQGGIRFNDSTPGDIYSTSQFIALTQGEDKKHFLTLRFGFGREAYQIIGPNQTLSDFPSQQLSLELRQWLGKDWGFDARAEQYHNPNYNRTGINLGIFKEF